MPKKKRHNPPADPTPRYRPRSWYGGGRLVLHRTRTAKLVDGGARPDVERRRAERARRVRV